MTRIVPGNLERLAREGEERRRAAEAEHAAAERTAAIRQRREVRRLGASNLLNALAENPPGPAVPLLRWTISAVVVSSILWIGGDVAGAPDAVSSVGLVGVLVIPFLYLGVRRWRAVLSLRRERAWLLDLPFPVRGYFALLSSTPEEERTATVRFRLEDDGPGEDIIRGLAGRSGGAVKVSRTRGSWVVESGVIHSYTSDDIEATNGPLLGWMRAVITETLLPLHAEHRVTSVRFRD
ncbi:hypothetical protein [Longimicrobium sp.]|jgi:hypothetical protein|uniref:hypothetical protein n=1 Tax=Longimicrobium sp. TaxID=2029185 RepID=UPI002F9521B8